MEIRKLWQSYNFPKCENCQKDCQGRLDYNNLCSNLNYLNKYAESNYEKNKESFIELKKIIGEVAPNIFSFGCGLGLDYVGAVEVFGDNVKYYGIDECNWAIRETANYKNFQPKLPKTVKFAEGMFLLKMVQGSVVLCFFNSLFTIANNTDLENELVNALQGKNNFYLVCDYTINNNFHMPKEEVDFINKLIYRFKENFKFKRFEILDGKGIIVCANHK